VISDYQGTSLHGVDFLGLCDVAILENIIIVLGVTNISIMDTIFVGFRVDSREIVFGNTSKIHNKVILC